ncbi:trans-aconitate 2-methyltransferase [Apibacter sp. HY039]|uniref:class I SAM-dependent methyltransferase n=1 Tax=Apibacter sp. HY039 TaxID=2501476 RepID=UPI000FEB6E03|nr:class I SAM-dependent methyltransferase [Apibacter sp. HY039]
MESVRSNFNSVAQKYDQQRSHLIPCFDDFYQIACENINYSGNSPKILDIGAGTGLFSNFVLKKYPDARITLVDLSEKMLEIAEKRFSDSPNVKIVCEDFTKHHFTDTYDVVISSLAIHHLVDQDKIELYNSIYFNLNQGGIFINAEQISGSSEYFVKLYEERWKEKIENSGLTDEEINAAYERIKLDKRSPLFQQLTWLSDAGFKEVDCLYKYYDFAVIYAKK